MSKYSIMLGSVNKMEEDLLNRLRAEVEGKNDDLKPEETAALDPQLFNFVNNDMSEAEKTGYSNYSYWGSTLRIFMKNKLAVATFFIIVFMRHFR